ncbi:MAG: NAD-binding protein, partial [Conexibacter sp.]
SQGRALDGSARLLLGGLGGLAAVLLLDTLAGIAAHGDPPVDALYAAVKTIATVGPNPHTDSAPTWFKLFSAAMMAASLALAATFTAGLVSRLSGRRLMPIFGRHTAPRRDHVVVVGLGQVGLRLCRSLLATGIPVIAVEQNPDSPQLQLARAMRIPVVVGRGGDRYLLSRIGIERARALAAVTSEDVTNIAACVAARALAPDVQIVLRAGDSDVTAESQSLFRLGTVCDVLRLTATVLAAAATGSPAREAFFDDAHRVVLVDPDGRLAPSGRVDPKTGS